jgi:hypothetical protein
MGIKQESYTGSKPERTPKNWRYVKSTNEESTNEESLTEKVRIDKKLDVEKSEKSKSPKVRLR